MLKKLLDEDMVLTQGECDDLNEIYKKTRTPVHHGIVGRYLQSLGEARDDCVANIFWGDDKAHITTGEADIEDAIDRHGASELDKVITLIENLAGKFPKAKLKLTPIVP